MSSKNDVNLKDPRVRAEIYMQTHGIKELFETLGTHILFHRPQDPHQFIIEKLNELKKNKEKKTHAPFFDHDDLEALYAMFDITDKGYITVAQYQKALSNLGIERPSMRLAESITTINRNVFMRTISQEIKNASASFM